MLNMLTSKQLQILEIEKDFSKRLNLYKNYVEINKRLVKQFNLFYNKKLALIEFKNDYRSYKKHLYYTNLLDFNFYVERKRSITFKFVNSFKFKRFYNKNMLTLIVDDLTESKDLKIANL